MLLYYDLWTWPWVLSLVMPMYIVLYGVMPEKHNTLSSNLITKKSILHCATVLCVKSMTFRVHLFFFFCHVLHWYKKQSVVLQQCVWLAEIRRVKTALLQREVYWAAVQSDKSTICSLCHKDHLTLLLCYKNSHRKYTMNEVSCSSIKLCLWT